MIKYKYHSNGNNTILQLTFLWVFAISLHWYVSKGDHLELSISLGPIDFRIGTSIWWNKIII